MNRILVGMLVLAFPLVAAPPRAPEYTGAEHILLHNGQTSEAEARLVGGGIDLGDGRASRPQQTSRGQQIIWKEVRVEIDRFGRSHHFYSQFLHTDEGESELVGGQVGVHLDRNGTLRAILGTQFINADVVNKRALSAAAAVERAIAATNGHPIRKGRKASLGTAEIGGDAVRFYLRGLGDGQTFRNAVDIAIGTADGLEAYEVTLDASSGELISITSLQGRNNCSPDSSLPVGATGIPIRSGVSTRSLVATPSSVRPPFSYEGSYPSSGGVAGAMVFHGTFDSTFQCNAPATLNFTLLPLSTVSSIPTYQDGSGWAGSRAGDALYFTRQTMEALKTMGRTGWDNQGTVAKILVEWIGGPSDNAFFNYSGGTAAPLYSVVIPPPVSSHSLAASLDGVAHEWGHGVILASANFPPDGGLGSELIEAYADVIGHAVEKLRQPAGYAAEESSDWHQGEDQNFGAANCSSNWPIRTAECDDGASGHLWAGHPVNDRLHAADTPASGTSDTFHDKASMLSVVMRLLTEGGYNPVCGRLSVSGCSTAVSPLGTTKAREILIDTLFYYAPSSASWTSLATYATQAAFDNYSACFDGPLNRAAFEQNAVRVAFEAIGYPRQTAGI